MLELYDIGTDGMRPVTQADVDELQRCRMALGLLVRFLPKVRQDGSAALAIELVQGRVTYTEAEACFDTLALLLEHTA